MPKHKLIYDIPRRGERRWVMLEKPKPCPVCGRDSGKIVEWQYPKVGRVWKVACGRCRSSTGYFIARISAVQAWNRAAKGNN